ncbi:MAG: hypothetical protein IKI20_07775 [Lachnospiraceae bacterium]|nr:hypothetical protein [Lachnospiraceae bacterium]
MPVINLEKLNKIKKEHPEQMAEINAFLQDLEGFENDIKEEYPYIHEEFSEYKNAFQGIVNSNSNDLLSGLYLRYLNDFKGFIEREPQEGMRSNYDIFMKYMDTPEKIRRFKSVCGILELGVELQQEDIQLEDDDIVKMEDPKADKVEELGNAKPKRLANVKPEDTYVKQSLEVAINYIEDIRDNQFKNAAEDYSSQEIDKHIDNVLRIMAARQLADSDRGSSAKLKKAVFTGDEVEMRVDEMKNDPMFKQFLNDVKLDRNLYNKLIKAASSKSGHGGKLDDIYKEYVKNLPARDLHNTRINERYMPTVKERIEILQNKAKNEKNLPEEAAAEIVVLRNLSRAEIGKAKTLDKKIPCFEKDTLCYESTKLSRNDYFKDSFGKNTVATGLLLKGHGGDMLQFLRDHFDEVVENQKRMEAEAIEDMQDRISNNMLEPGAIEVQQKEWEEDKEFTKSILEENLIGSNLERLQAEAKTLAKDLKAVIKNEKDLKELDAENPERNKPGKVSAQYTEMKKQLVEQGKLLIGEYLILIGKAWNSNLDTTDVSKFKLEVPGEELDKLYSQKENYNKDYTKFFEKFEAGDIAESLKMVSESKLPEFPRLLTQKKAQLDSKEKNMAPKKAEGQKKMEEPKNPKL